MKTLGLLSVSCAALVAIHGAAFAGGEGWTSDFEAAKKEAAESEKDLLIDFTGSDWCGWCIKLNDEVFKHDAFKNGVKDGYVLVEIDFPNDKSKLTEEVQKQNAGLGEEYGIQGYPTILLTDARGRPYGRTGYQKGGPEKYVEHLAVLQAQKKGRDEAFAEAAKKEGVEKAEALVAALDGMGLEMNLVTSQYGDVIEQIKKADPKDETGFVKKAGNQKRLKDFQAGLQQLAQKQDMDGALKLVEKTLKEGGFSSEETQQMMMTRAVILAEKKDIDGALKAIDEAKEYAPDSPLNPGIDQFRKRLEKSSKEASEEPAEEPAEEEAAE